MKKLLNIIIITVIIFITLISFIIEKFYPYPARINYGVTFSPRYARYLKLDWQKVYLQVLSELKVKNLRLPSYWSSLEPEEGKYDFLETDFMLSEAEKAGARVLLVVGERQPRWPECHTPSWVKKLTVSEKQQKVFEFTQKVVERYKDNNVIWAWQVENEPFAYWFGECGPLDKNFLQKEVELVKKLDKKSRPVIITDSGEWGNWMEAVASADMLGVSVYRKVYNSIFGIFTPVPFPASAYQLKTALVGSKKVIITELQTEPWLSRKDSKERLPQRQSSLFSIKDFTANVDFGKKIGFEEIYLWGVEWWYYMAQNGYPQYLNFAKSIFN